MTFDRSPKYIDSTTKTTQGRGEIHFLHIGKNAGTQIKRYMHAITQSLHDIQFLDHPHKVRLMDIPENAQYFFSIRNPISRFRSGFYSRKRKGQPRIYSEWNNCERRAFSEFEHANNLAEALYADGELGSQAFCAMKSISHLAMNQVDWFTRFGNMFEERPPIAIIRQECFDEDLKNFQVNLGLKSFVSVDEDSTLSHRSILVDIPPLSKKAENNLRLWYTQDFEFYRCCENWIAKSKNTNHRL